MEMSFHYEFYIEPYSIEKISVSARQIDHIGLHVYMCIGLAWLWLDTVTIINFKGKVQHW